MPAPLRINRSFERAPTELNVAYGVSLPSEENGTAAYMARLVALIPGEIVSLYITGASLVGASLPTAALRDRWIGLCWAALCLIMLVAVRVWGTSYKPKDVPPEWSSVVIAAVAYLIWLYNVGCPLDLLGIPFDAKIGPLLIFAWTFAVPYFYRGDSFGSVATGKSASELKPKGDGVRTNSGQPRQQP
jgi:hypothetical protein